MKLTKSKFQWGFGLFFLIPGIAFTAMSIIEFCAEMHPHGFYDAISFAIVGPLMAFTGITCLFDEKP